VPLGTCLDIANVAESCHRLWEGNVYG